MRTAIALTAALLVVAGAARADERYDREELERYRRAQDRIIDGTDAPSGGGYAAIAYSRATQRWGAAWNYPDLRDAKAQAVRECKARDADWVVYVRHGYCALATADDGMYGVGYGDTARQAKSMALRECGKRTERECRVAVCLYSGD